MDLIKELLHTTSCSLVGMEKNTGKTVTLNYLLQHLPREHRVAVTSIGLDGETKDQVTGTKKPEILLYSGTIFATSEKHYRQRLLRSEVMDVSDESTALGRLVTARVLQEGKIMLSGLGHTAGLKRWMDWVKDYVDLIIVDGALSRKSLASPSITETAILATGAACSTNMDTLVRKTKHVVELMQIPLWQAPPDSTDNADEEIIELVGSVTDHTLEQTLNNSAAKGKTVIIQDFTKVFADEALWHRFTTRHPVYVRQRSRLLGITVNPTAPNGMILDSDLLCRRLNEETGIPAYDLMKL